MREQLGLFPTVEVVQSSMDAIRAEASARGDAFDGLSNDTLRAILESTTPEEISGFVAALHSTPQPVEVVRAALRDLPWFPGHTEPDTQRRRMRILRDAAVASGHPVCSTNAGYFLGSWTDVRRSAERARRFAEGAYRRARLLEALADRSEKQ